MRSSQRIRKNNISKIIVVISIIIILAFIFKIVKENSYTKNDNIKVNSSEEYQKWMQLSEEEKQSTGLKPRSVNVEYDFENKQSNEFNIVSKIKGLFKETSSEYSLSSKQIDTESLDEYIDSISSYNLVNMKCTTPVKDQKSWNYCWAYGTTSSLESTILNKTRNSYKDIRNNSIDISLNPMHIGYALAYNGSSNKYANKELNDGGNSFDTMLYLSSGLGPVSTNDFSITSDAAKNNLDITSIMVDTAKVDIDNDGDGEEIYADNILELPTFNNTNVTQAEQAEFTKFLKETLLEYGAISFGSAAPLAYYDHYGYYDDINKSVNTNNSVEVNSAGHMMMIVGWDDNYSKYNFNSTHRPSTNGAWIVQNSWGTGNGIGVDGKGFYYYSYEDYGLNNRDLFVTASVTEKDFDKIYQYNPTGDLYSIPGEYAVNIYDKKDTESEYINKVSFVNINQKSTYKIYVYSNVNSINDITEENADEIINYTDNNQYMEYVTVSLPERIKITGDKFAVMIKFENEDNIPIQTNASNLTNEGVDIKNNYAYISDDLSNWNDASKINLENSAGVIINTGISIMIKAMTQYDEDIVLNTELSTNNLVLDGNSNSIIATTTTANMPESANLTYTIRDTEKNDVTSLFDISTSKNDNIYYFELKVLSKDEIVNKRNFELEVKYADKVNKVNFSVEKQYATSFNLIEDIIYVQPRTNIDITSFFDIYPYVSIENSFDYQISDTNILSITNNIITTLNEGSTNVTIIPERTELSKTIRIKVIDLDNYYEGNGTKLNPYLVSKAEDIENLNLVTTLNSSQDVYLKLTNDIDLTDMTSTSEGCYYNSGLGFNSIGSLNYTYNGASRTRDKINYFTGNIDGSGYSIIGLKINRPNEDYIGLFVGMQGAEINNLSIKSANIIANNYVSILSNYIEVSEINNLKVTGSNLNGNLYLGSVGSQIVETNLNYVKNDTNIYGRGCIGGIAYNIKDNVVIANTYNKGNIKASGRIDENHIGGSSIAGIVSSCGGSGTCEISKVFNSGEVKFENSWSGYSYTAISAGIVGACYGELNINDTYNTGNIYAGTGASGIISSIASTEKTTIENVYNIGNIEVYTNIYGDASDIYSNVYNDMQAEINHAYGIENENIDLIGTNLENINSSNIILNDVVKKTSEQLKNKSNYNSNFDFQTIWQENENTYPTLKNVEQTLAKEITSTISKVEITNGNTYNVQVEVSPQNTDNKNVIYEIEDKDIAIIDNTGKITTKGSGSTNVIVKACDNSNVSLTIPLIVKSNLVGVLTGNGTIRVPFEINNQSEFNKIREDLNAYYILKDDIDFTGIDNWNPIGTYENEFTGELNGNGFTIFGLDINENASITNNIFGLFGIIRNSYIYNFKLKDMGVSVNTNEINSTYNVFTGVLAGNIYNSTISNIYNINSSIDSIGSTGGIAGYTEDSEIERCFNSGKINGIESTEFYSIAGGIIGQDNNSKVRECYNVGIITSKGTTAGIVGISSNIEITDCYNIGNIYGKETSGGIIGESAESIINRVYNTGTITSESNCKEIIVYGGKANISNAYYTNNKIGAVGTIEDIDDSNISNVEYKTLDQIKTQKIFTNEDVWLFESGIIPILRNIERQLVSFEIQTEPTKTTYEYEENINLNGGNIKAIYMDTGTEIIPMSDSRITIEGYDSKFEGIQNIKVIYGNCYKEFKIQVNEQVIPDTYVIVDTFIKNIAKKTLITTLKDKLLTDITESFVVKRDEEEITEDTLIGTGDILTTESNKNYILIVRGDLTQDGIVDIRDIMRVRRYFISSSNLNDNQKKAADITNDNIIDIRDLMRMRRFAVE